MPARAQPSALIRRPAVIIALQALGTFAILGSFLPLLTLEGWYIRVFDYPRVQLLGLALLVLLLYLWLGPRTRLRDKALLLGLSAAILLQAVNIYPYTFLYPPQVEQASENTLTADTEVSIMVANVYMNNEKYQPLIDLVNEHDPDILLLLETNMQWQKAVVGATKRYPHRVEIPQDNTYGMHLYSKLPLRQKKERYLLEEEIPSIKTFVQLPNGIWAELYAVHPKPPVPTEDPNSKKRDAEIVIVAREISDSDHPVIVAGDFNDVAWSRTTRLFLEISRLLDPRIGRGFFNTFNANYLLLRWPLDHIFHSGHFKLLEMETLPDIASDHFPIYIRLSFAPGNKYEQQTPPADEEAQEEATETIIEGKQEAKEPEE